MSWADAVLLLLFVVSPLVGAAFGVVLGGRLALSRVRALEYAVEALSSQLIKEVRRRAGEKRWEGAAEEVESAITEIRRLAIGETDSKGWLQGKEGGVQRGPV